MLPQMASPVLTSPTRAINVGTTAVAVPEYTIETFPRKYISYET